MSKTKASTKSESRACEVIVITSGKGGVGKTTTTATLGAALALQGQRTLVIDADIGLRNLDVILGLENRIVFDLVDVSKGRCKPLQALIKSKKSPNLFLLPASQTDDKDVIDEAQFAELIQEYRSSFNFILVDSPAGIEQGFRNASSGVDRAMIVATPEVSSIRDADRVIGLLSSRGVESALIVNRVDADMVRRGDMLSLKDVQEILGIELIGVVERDENVIIAANCGEPAVFNAKSKAGRAFERIAKRLMGENIPIHNPATTSLWQRFSRSLGI